MNKINNQLGRLSKYFCNQMIENSKAQHYGYEENYKKQFEEVTLKEQIFKNQNILIGFKCDKRDLSDLQLKVFVNNELKYASQSGVFIVSKIQVPIWVKGRFLPKIKVVEKDRLIFKHQSQYEGFVYFIRKLRDCTQVQEMFEKLCITFCEDIESNIGRHIGDSIPKYNY